MSELDAERREALAEVVAEHSIRFREHEGDWAAACKCGEIIATNPGADVPNVGSEFYPVVIRGERAHVADALAPLIAGWLVEAEQRGREDNADHGMCYVHGSRALEARLAEAKGEALREAATDPSLRLSGHSGISITRLLDRADRAAETEQEDA